MQIQSNLGSTIAMAFDECPPSKADESYIRNSVARTTRWLARCKAKMAELNSLPDTVNPHQLLFGINQGGSPGGCAEGTRADHQRDGSGRVRHRRSGSGRDPRGDVPHPGRDGALPAGRLSRLI